MFRESMRLCRENERLKTAIENSIRNQKVYWEEKDITVPDMKGDAAPRLVISEKRTLEAAGPYAREGRRVCALNFASFVQPGGGVKKGAGAQEESICRISTLFPALDDKDTAGTFYEKHRAIAEQNKESGRDFMEYRRNRDDCIYTPGVIVFRKDTHDCELMPEEDWYETDIISCAAPDLRNAWQMPDSSELYSVIESRVLKVIQAAACHQAEVLILGAFGCGVFRNPPEMVASAFETVLKQYGPYFETVEFALGHDSRDGENYRAFAGIRDIITR